MSNRPGFRRRPRVADQMTPELLACVDHALAAERAGDAAEAWEWHRAVPMFRRGRHTLLMRNLVGLGPDLPPWVWARWIAYQTTRCEDGELGEVHRLTLRTVTEVMHPVLLESCYLDGEDPVQVTAQVFGESWAFQQLMVHEMGGLELFVDQMATGRLVEHADLARQWVGTPLGGYRIGESLPGGRLQVRDASSDEEIEVLDLGARSCLRPGLPERCVLGRLVPSGVEDLPLFDVPPLAVPESLACEVAASGGAGAWTPVVTALADGRLDPDLLLREDYELACDVQELDLVHLGTRPSDRERVMQQLRSGRDEVSRAAYRILARARDGEIPAEDAALVAAASLNPLAIDDARRRLVRPGCPEPWTAWAQRVPEPGRRQLRRLAAAAAPAA